MAWRCGEGTVRRTSCAGLARIATACGGSVRGRTVGVLGLTFKPETDDMRDSPALAIVSGLVEDGAVVQAFDPEGMEQARPLLPAGVRYCHGAMEAVAGADVLVVVTEWNEFRSLAPADLKAAMRGDVVVDLRNVYDPEAMREAGFADYSIGRGP